MLKLDGSKLEGGGQLTRMALCLSAITGQVIQIHSIRAGRGSKSSFKSSQTSRKAKDKSSAKNQKNSTLHSATPTSAGGLKESHLAALQWLAAMTFADVDGAEVGSTEVSFYPGRLKGKFGPDIPHRAHVFESQRQKGGPIIDTIRLKNPGSIWLIFQAIYPYMALTQTNTTSQQNDTLQFSESNQLVYDLTFIGGTNVPKSMSTEYVAQVFAPICEKIGLPRVEIETVKSGWTTGRIETGEVRLRMYSSTSIPPSTRTASFPGFSLLDRGTITKIELTILSTPHLFPTLTDLVTTTISSHASYQAAWDVTVHSTVDSGHERRLYILLVAHTSTGMRLGYDYLGSGAQPRNARDEELSLTKAAKQVVDGLMAQIDRGGSVDEFMQDQLVTFQALAGGPSLVRGSCDDKGDGDSDEESGDSSGSLHTRTVRWVCQQMLPGVKFKPGGVCEVGS